MRGIWDGRGGEGNVTGRIASQAALDSLEEAAA